MSTPQKLTHGPGWIYVAPVGTTLPTHTDLAALRAGTFPGFTSVGQTSAPVTFRDTLERTDTRSTQSLRAIAQHNSGADAEVETELLEVTLDRIAEAIEGTQSGSGAVIELTPASEPGQATYYALAVVGPYGADRTMLWVAENVAVKSALELAYTREEDTTLAVTWGVYAGTEEGLGEAGYHGYAIGAAATTPATVVGAGVDTAELDFTDPNDTSFTVQVGSASPVTITLDADLTDADALLDELETALTGQAVTVTVTSGNVVTITATNTTASIIIGGTAPTAIGLTAGTYAPGA